MNRPSQDGLAEALANCALEPVHTPGAIQPGGCLVCTDGTLSHVLQVSANIAELFGLTPDAALALSPRRLLGRSLVDAVLQFLADDEPLPLTVERRQRWGERRARLQATIYRSGERLVFELEPLSSLMGMGPLVKVNRWLRELSGAQSRDRLLAHLVHAAHQLAGYERILVYQFDEHWHGTVVSEVCHGPFISFLGHRFPASDIPPQVRDLYDINPVRSIPDATAPAVALVSGDGEGGGTPLDLGQGYLRAASPVHLRYMANMGVGASLSAAIHDGERGLWGLLACHHSTPKPLSPQIRDAILALVRMASQRLFLLQSRDEMRYLKKVLDSRELVTEHRGTLVAPDQLVREHGREWLDLFDACGLALLSSFGICRVGDLPEQAVLERIATRLTASHHHHAPWISDQLGETTLADVGNLGGCCGLLALPLAVESPPGWFMLFRPEEIRSHRWAGNPHALSLDDTNPGNLSPRHSFATWVEEVRGQCRPWRPLEQQAAQDLAEDLAVAVSVNHIAHLNQALNQANSQLQSLASTDSLTGLRNRYHMEQAIDAEVEGARRYGRCCSVLLLDIDHFKRFNDSHGHEAGDRVLQSLARTVESCLRTVDCFGRWGGEEFLVLTGGEAEGARVLAERIRARVESLDLGPLGRLTVSIGIAQFQQGDGRRALVARADKALYEAKGAGRNLVVVG